MCPTGADDMVSLQRALPGAAGAASHQDCGLHGADRIRLHFISGLHFTCFASVNRAGNKGKE